MKPEIALAVVVAAGLGTVGVTIAVGQSVREPTVVANPYEAGLHHAEAAAAQRKAPAPPAGAARVSPPCDLGDGACTLSAASYEVTLELAPRPLRTMTELAVAARVRGPDGGPAGGRTVTVHFQMRGMEMGENRSELAEAAPGRYAGKAVLVRCPSGRRDWTAAVVVGGQAATVVTKFELSVAE